MDRRTLALSSIIGILVVALGVVGVLILRKRAAFPLFSPTVSQQPSARKLPTDTKPYSSFPTARPWQPGDPIPTSSPPIPAAIPLQPSS